jgi:hypothetical protein
MMRWRWWLLWRVVQSCRGVEARPDSSSFISDTVISGKGFSRIQSTQKSRVGCILECGEGPVGVEGFRH